MLRPACCCECCDASPIAAYVLHSALVLLTVREPKLSCALVLGTSPPPQAVAAAGEAGSSEEGAAADIAGMLQPGSKAARLFEKFHKAFMGSACASETPLSHLSSLAEKVGPCKADRLLDADLNLFSDGSESDADVTDEIIQSKLDGARNKACAVVSPPPEAPAEAPPSVAPPPGASGAAQAGVAAPVPPPPVPHAAARPSGRTKRAQMWGPFQIARIVPGNGEQTGWGATCGRHGKDCQRNLSYFGRGGRLPLNDDECVRQLKRWLIAGLAIDRTAPDARARHMKIELRTLGPQSDPEDLITPPVVPDDPAV